MTPAVRNARDALVGIALFFAAQALVSEAHAASKEIDTMNKVIRRYFVAVGDKAREVATEGLKRANEARLAGILLAKNHGALGTFGRSSGTPYALVWDDGLVPDPHPGFLSPELHVEDGKRYQVCRPDKRTAIGKSLDTALKALPVFSFSDYACEMFDVSQMLLGTCATSSSGMAAYHSVAGYMKEQLVFSIPFGGNQGCCVKVEDVVIPPEFREITAGEFIDITQEQPS